MYLAFFYEKRQKNKEALDIVEQMINEGVENPYPNLCFLIEDRCYTDSSNFMYEFRDKLVNKINKPILSSDSVVFDFL
jgi:hypothetical protein